MTAYRVRPAEPPDTGEIADLLAAQHVETTAGIAPLFTQEKAADALFSSVPALAAVVAELPRGGLIGAALWRPCYDIEVAARGGFLVALTVAAEFRRAGVGAALCAAVARDVRRGGGAFLWGVTRPRRSEAGCFLERLGADLDPVIAQMFFGPSFTALASRPTEAGDD